jgi:phosphatidylinositol 3-kinase
MASMATDAHLWSVVDPEVARDNPVEDKHRRLVRSHRSSPYDRELKPNAKIRDELGVGVNSNLLSHQYTDLIFCREFSTTHPVRR